MEHIKVPAPDLQIDFSIALSQARNSLLQDALGETIQRMELRVIDRQLAEYAPAKALLSLARRGLRGELLFVVPSILVQNPRLLGYYRLLLGFSQKTFYTSELGLSRFKSMEDKGILTPAQANLLNPLCREMNQCAHILLTGIGLERVSRELLDDLTLLTLGPQLRGGTNVKIGIAAIGAVFKVIYQIVALHAKSSNPNKIEVLNAAGRKVLIEFAADPDIIIREEMAPQSFRNIIAIEVKGGKDYSNIHNRIGEAEKSHQTARKAGYVECWTVVNVKRLDLEKAKRESPSTNLFFRLTDLESGKGKECEDFRNRMISLTGIPATKGK